MPRYFDRGRSPQNFKQDLNALFGGQHPQNAGIHAGKGAAGDTDCITR